MIVFMCLWFKGLIIADKHVQIRDESALFYKMLILSRSDFALSEAKLGIYGSSHLSVHINAVTNNKFCGDNA